MESQVSQTNQYYETLLAAEDQSTGFAIPKKKTTFDEVSYKPKTYRASQALKVSTIEDALEISGGFGRFQCCQVAICCLTMIRCGLQYYPLPYLEL